MKNNHAMASIKCFEYFNWYEPSDLKSEECQFGTLGLFKTAAQIQDGCQNRGNLLVLFFETNCIKKNDIVCTEESETQILVQYSH